MHENEKHTKEISEHINYIKAEPIFPSHMLSTGNTTDKSSGLLDRILDSAARTR